MGSNITNVEALQNASATFEAKLSATFENPDSNDWAPFVDFIGGHDQKHFELDVLSAYPAMKRWLTERTIQSLRAQKRTYEVEKFEATLGIDLVDVKFDSVVADRINKFAAVNANWMDDFFQEVYESTAAILAYNGQPLLSDSHPHYNSGAGLDNLTTDALSPSAVRSGVQTMETATDERGRNLGVYPTHLMVGPANRETGSQITGSNRLVGIQADGTVDGATNVAAGVLQNYVGGSMSLVVNKKFDSNQWCLIDNSGPIKPLIYVENEAPTLTVLDQPDDPNIFNEDKWIGGILARGFFLPGEPSRIYGRQ